MNRLLLLLTIFVSQSCTDEPARRLGAPELVGTWLMMNEGVRFPQGCNSSLPVQYYSDGTLRLWGESGTWRLEGDRLIETSTDFDPLIVDRSDVQLGKPYVSTLRWNDRNRIWKQYADGDIREFLRCPKRT